jgi:hypothetical protein
MDYSRFFDELDNAKTPLEEYNELEAAIEELSKQVSILEEDKLIKKYNGLLKIRVALESRKKSLYRFAKMEEYENCTHIFVDLGKYNHFVGNLDDITSLENIKGVYRGCVKCGLREDLIDKDYDEIFTEDDLIMHDYLIKKDYLPSHSLDGVNLNVKCDLELGKSIYKKIEEAHPDLKTYDACGYFMSAYCNMKKDNNPTRIKSRIRRLSLNKWPESR